MRVIYGIGQIKKRYSRPIVAIGVFDGLHCGHQYLIKKVIKRARAVKGTSMVLTFSPHPVHVLKPKAYLPFLISLRHRLRLIEKMGVKVCIVVDFTKRFSDLASDKFIDKYFVRSICPKEVFVGDNFRFGKNCEGDLSLLRKIGKQNGFKVNSIAPIKRKGKVVSSTLIRKLITEGKLKNVTKFLGRPVSVFGRVKKGHGRGKILGFPTANINPLREIIPPCGVYLVRIEVDGRYLNGLANVGVRPSFKIKKRTINIEVNIFNFNKNIYGKDIEVSFLTKIRDEKKFQSKIQLVNQLKRDKDKAKALLKNLK